MCVIFSSSFKIRFPHYITRAGVGSFYRIAQLHRFRPPATSPDAPTALRSIHAEENRQQAERAQETGVLGPWSSAGVRRADGSAAVFSTLCRRSGLGVIAYVECTCHHARLAAGCVLQDIFLFDFRERKADLLVIAAGAGRWLDGEDDDFFHGDAEEVHRDTAGLAHNQYGFRYAPAVQAKSHQVGACAVHLVHDDEVLDSGLGVLQNRPRRAFVHFGGCANANSSPRSCRGAARRGTHRKCHRLPRRYLQSFKLLSLFKHSANDSAYALSCLQIEPDMTGIFTIPHFSATQPSPFPVAVSRGWIAIVFRISLHAREHVGRNFPI